MADYATAKEVYKELREALGPWTKANGFRKWPGTAAGWQRPQGALELLRFKFEVSVWGDSETGNALTGHVQTDPSPGDLTATPIRQDFFTGCLIGHELDRLAAIQGAINRRRPALPAQHKNDVGADTRLGLHLRELYDPSPKYQEGQHVPLSYYGIDDVREWTRLIVEVLPAVLDRHTAGNTPRPINTTPEHLKPKWLRDYPKNILKKD
jgi:hypothetical protein